MERVRARDIFVYVPGIIGSVLVKDGKVLWDASPAAYFRLLRNAEARKSLEVTGIDDGSVDDLGDGVTAERVIELPFNFYGLVKSVGPRTIRDALYDMLDFEEPSLTRAGNFHLFAYDWRRSNRHSAKKLKEFIDPLLAQWRRQLFPDAKVVVIAHSMGGLVSRYWAECLGGAEDCRAIFTFGTPHRGSNSIADYIANGFHEKGLDLSDLVKTLASAHELLPIDPIVHDGSKWTTIRDAKQVPFDPGQVENGWAFHDELAGKAGDYLHPCVGWGQKTPQWLEASGGKIKVRFDPRPGVLAALSDGDGRVPRLSAVPGELARKGREVYVPDSHAGVQRNAFLLQNMMQHVLQMQWTGATAVLGEPRAIRSDASIDVGVSDVYTTAEESLVTITPNAPEFSRYIVKLRDTPIVQTVETKGQPTTVSLGHLQPGRYGVTVESEFFGAYAPPPVFEMFDVIEEG